MASLVDFQRKISRWSLLLSSRSLGGVLVQGRLKDTKTFPSRTLEKYQDIPFKSASRKSRHSVLVLFRRILLLSSGSLGGSLGERSLAGAQQSSRQCSLGGAFSGAFGFPVRYVFRLMFVGTFVPYFSFLWMVCSTALQESRLKFFSHVLGCGGLRVWRQYHVLSSGQFIGMFVFN